MATDPCYESGTLEVAGCCCGDVAVLVRVVEVNATTALVEDRLGERAWVAIDFVEAQLGDVLLLQLGVAIGRLEP